MRERLRKMSRKNKIPKACPCCGSDDYHMSYLYDSKGNVLGRSTTCLTCRDLYCKNCYNKFQDNVFRSEGDIAFYDNGEAEFFNAS